jgi:serine/threonine protein kinase
MVDPSSLLGLIVDGRYRLATVVGTGSYGWVYAADETAFGEVIGQVAVKLLRPPDDAARKAVIREVQAMRQLTHPNLLGCYAAGQVSDGLASGCLYIATELGSETLEDRLKSAQRMGPDEVREAAEHVALALAYLCDRGAVHRDVKPANILRVGNVWKLGDFGLVRGFAGTSMQASGRKGTVVYMSPEAMLGETGPFVDVWALGAVIQECLTGTLPYSGNSDTEIIAAALTREPSICGELAEPFSSVVKTCLSLPRRTVVLSAT